MKILNIQAQSEACELKGVWHSKRIIKSVTAKKQVERRMLISIHN